MTNKITAMKSSVERAFATRRNSGRSNTRPKTTMTARAITACSKAVPRLLRTEPPEPAARIEMNIRIGMTARSCASRIEKLARPTVVVRRSWFDKSSSTIAVEDNDRLAPRITASEADWPSSNATLASNAVVSSTCEPPRPNTSRRIANSR